MYAGHFFPVMSLRILKRITNNAGTCFSRNNLGCMNRILIDLLFHANVKVFRILPENDHVNIMERSLNRDIGFRRTNIGIEVIFLSQRYVQGTETMADRSCDWRFQQHMIPVK